MGFQPTDEQVAALDLFLSGQSLAIEAGAGTGKTSTLKMIADTTARAGTYVAFNKAIVTEAGEKMPPSVRCSTAHALAFREVGRAYGARLRSTRMRSAEIARMIGLRPITVTFGSESKPLSDGYLGGYVMRAITRFCQTADPAPTLDHFPYIDGIDMPIEGKRTYANNMVVRHHCERALAVAWRDLMDIGGQLPYRHDHYLKAWQLSRPKIHSDFILFDEAQDANPVMQAIVSAQDHAQLVWVGDSQQAIYEFTGAVNALATVPADNRAFLTHSFRFGPEIAEIANGLLEAADAELRLTGRGPAGVVGKLDRTEVLLTRTNATGVQTMFIELAAGRRPHIVGGANDVLAFARAAVDLKAGRFVSHQDLACFTSWGQVQEYVEQDPQGSELKLLVGLIDDFGADRIAEAIDRMPHERNADLLISTAHKSKGREWDAVTLAPDFPDPDDRDGDGKAEWRLLYVACTRARKHLDATEVRHAMNPQGDHGDPDARMPATLAQAAWEADH